MKPNNLLVVVIGLIVAGVSFLATIGTSPETRAANDPHLNRWLGLSKDQIKAIDEADPGFDKEAAELADTLSQAKGELASALEDDDATDERILERVESAIAAHDALERRVAQHLLNIRSHLAPEQRSRLMGLCAEGVRASQRHQYRHGQDANAGGRGQEGSGPPAGRGPNGGGPPEGRGWNRGQNSPDTP